MKDISVISEGFFMYVIQEKNIRCNMFTSRIIVNYILIYFGETEEKKETRTTESEINKATQ